MKLKRGWRHWVPLVWHPSKFSSIGGGQMRRQTLLPEMQKPCWNSTSLLHLGATKWYGPRRNSLLLAAKKPSRKLLPRPPRQRPVPPQRGRKERQLRFLQLTPVSRTSPPMKMMRRTRRKKVSPTTVQMSTRMVPPWQDPRWMFRFFLRVLRPILGKELGLRKMPM